MPVKDARPEITLSEEESTRLRNRLEDMITQAQEFRKSSEWDDLHADYWRMYRADPITKIRTWPWENASNLYIPLAKVAINATIAQEYEAMLSNEPHVIGTEGGDEDLADDLTQYYFSYYYKKVMPLNIWGTDWLLDNAIDGTSSMKIRQNTDFQVRRYESMVDVPVMKDVPGVGLDGAPTMESQLDRLDYEWREEATIERVNQTMGDVADMTRIYMAPETGAGIQSGSALYADSCPWYYQQSYLSWDEVMSRKRSLNWDVDDDLKAHQKTPESSPKERATAEESGVSDTSKKDKIEVLEFYMPWPLPEKYRKIEQKKPDEEIKQKSGNEDGYMEEIVVNYAPDAKKILLIRPLSRVCPDSKRPNVSMHYQRVPRFIYGIGQSSELRDLQAGMNKSWNQRVDYGDLSNMPWGFYSPGATGLLPEISALEPGRMYEVMDPRGIYFHKFSMDPMNYISQEQAIQGWAEKVSRVTEALMGKAPTTPNAPRTARGQLSMIQQNNMQFAVLTGIHSESFIEVFRRIHAFKKRWAPASESFRVLNKQTGMFIQKEITDKAFQYDADFDFTMQYNRTQAQQVSQQLFGMTISALQQAIASPMLSETIRQLTSDVYRDLGRKNFDRLWPKDMVQNIVMQAQSNMMQQNPPQNAQPPQGGGQGGAPLPATEQGPPPAPGAQGPAPQNLNMQMGGV